MNTESTVQFPDADDRQGGKDGMNFLEGGRGGDVRSRCAHAVLMLRSCCAHAALMLCSCCAHAALMLCSCCAHAVLMLRSCCAHAALMLCSCCSHVVLMLSKLLPISTSRFIFLSSLLFLAFHFSYTSSMMDRSASGPPLAFKTSLSHAISLPITYHHKVYVKQPDMQGCFSKQKPGPGRLKKGWLQK